MFERERKRERGERGRERGREMDGGRGFVAQSGTRIATWANAKQNNRDVICYITLLIECTECQTLVRDSFA